MLADSRQVDTSAEAPAIQLKLVALGTARAGEEVTVRLIADSAIPVSHLPEALRFDPEALEVVRVEGGDFLGAGGEAQVLSDYSRPGELLLGASRLGERPGVTGRGVVATIVFRALRDGQTTIEWDVTQALGGDLKPLAGVDAKPLVLKVGGEPREAAKR